MWGCDRMIKYTAEIELPDIIIDKDKRVKFQPTIILDGRDLCLNGSSGVISKVWVGIQVCDEGKHYGYGIINGLVRWVGRKTRLYMKKNDHIIAFREVIK